ADGLVIAHLGDLGEIPGSALQAALDRPDVLLVPVGGFYTMDAAQAARTVELLRPRVVIPMHYRTDKGGYAQISTVEPFLAALQPLVPSRQPLLRLTREDMSEQPRLVVLEPS
ncbi:MAG TPA: MBL fold metallo-hydrolase, partial [Candidatus Limnocylindria bacterium]|nr:MBL fold metallo-hydrolase [Candidatus Limnocylindria bacterium]